MQPTEEQVRIVGAQARRLVVQAGAGAAKTTTLTLYAAARPSRRILYLAFNKSVQQEAQSRMPSNVVCRTTHSMAWKVASRMFGQDARNLVGSTYPSSLAKALGCSPLAAVAAIQTVNRWCGSPDDRIDLEHLPLDLAARFADPQAVVDLARGTWSLMTSKTERSVLLPHDGYLKIYQLQKPSLEWFDEGVRRYRQFDDVLVDESQDLNPSTFDIVRRQRSALVLVGDEAQAIYSFRGSMNALAELDADARLTLTRSFRFGEGVAALANALLGHFKEGDRPLLVGAGEPRRTRLSVDMAKPFAVIARTNAVIFEEAVTFLESGRRYHFVGGPEGYRLEKILDAYYLSVGDAGLVRDPYLRSFESFDALALLAEETEDPELLHLVRVIVEYGHRVPGLVDEIQARHQPLEKAAWSSFPGIFFSTAHKAKGLEFEQVWLANDFMKFFDDGRELEPDEVDQAEVNLLYVAATRARAAIRVNEAFTEWLNHRRLMPAC